MKEKEWTTDELRHTAERIMSWEEGDSNVVSFPTLIELVREKDPELYSIMVAHKRAGKHLYG